MDGLSTAEVDELFREADHDGDGRLAGNEAKAFFQRTSLPVQALSKVPHLQQSPSYCMYKELTLVGRSEGACP